MQPRTFDQILSSVQAQSDPQRQTVLNQIADLPNQQAAAESGLNAQKDQAYQDIVSGAQQRGIGFSGIPLQEQAKYNATNYAPALANLKSTYANQKGTLESALAGIGQNDYSTAQNQFNTEQALAEQQRQFDLNYQLQKQQLGAQNAYSTLLAGMLGGGNNATPAAAAPTAQMVQRSDKGFNFTDQNGNAINAAQYAHLTGQDFRNVLQVMASHGDTGAQAALGFVGNDYGYDPTKVTSPALANLYKALTGQMAQIYQTPKQIAQSNVKSLPKATAHPLWEQLINPVNWI